MTDSIKSHPLPNCSVCGSDGSFLYKELSDRLFGSEGTWNIKKCNNPDCGLFWLDPMPDEDEIGKAYETYYTHDSVPSNILPSFKPLEKGYLAMKFGYNEKVSFFQKLIGLLLYLIPTEKAEADYSILYFSSHERGKLLDIGCGNGTFLSRMKNFDWDVAGIDFDVNAVDYCVKNGLNVNVGALHQQKFNDGIFDVVTINHVIEHVPDAGEVIKECYRILKPGGCLVIATPNTKGRLLENGFKQNYFSLDPPRHLFLFNGKNLKTLVERAGFKTKYVKTTIRNEFYVYAGSRQIKKEGHFKMGQEKLPKFSKFIGKLVQLWGWFLLGFFKDSGSEVVIKTYK